MTKEQIKFVLNIIRPAIRALTGEQKIRMTGYDNVVMAAKTIRDGNFYIATDNKKFHVYIHWSQIIMLKEV